MPKNKYLFPLILVTALFFLWGFAYGLLDVLNKHFQEALNITRSRSTLIQAAYFGAYFLIALPAGLFMNKYGYKKGIVLGLLCYALGAFLFYPAAQRASFDFFLLALFILASGLACLETAANPYVTVLGAPETSESRLNLSQCFNGVGSFLGPIIAAKLFFGNKDMHDLGSVKLIYIIIGIVVLCFAILFIRTRLPEIKESEIVSSPVLDKRPLWSQRHFVGGVIAQFFYVAAQVGIAALFINYCTEAKIGIDNAKASELLSISLLLFTLGRFIGTALMRRISPHKLLTVYAIINIGLCLLVIAGKAWISVYALMIIFLFESIMFPTIFALGIKDLGHNTKKASSFIIMSIVGGALVPYIMGVLADDYSTAFAYIVPMLCFVVVAWYGWKGYRIRVRGEAARYCLALDLNRDPDLIAEYEQWHREVWPEIKKSIRDGGIADMEIYRLEDRLFMIMETEEGFSFEKKAAMDNANPAVRRWEELMWKYQVAVPGGGDGEKWRLMKKIFSLRGE